jgi:Ca2+-binding EF-hand superfamily protein
MLYPPHLSLLLPPPSGKFSQGEVRSLMHDFKDIAKSGKIDRQQFREAIGLLGSFRDSIIPDRLFDAFDMDRDGYINGREYVTGMSVMTRGTAEEKLELSFKMADLSGTDCVTIDEVHLIFESMYRILSSLGLRAGVGSQIWRSDIQALFKNIEPGKEEITLAEYKVAMRGLDLVEWLQSMDKTDLTAEGAVPIQEPVAYREPTKSRCSIRVGAFPPLPVDENGKIEPIYKCIRKMQEGLLKCLEDADIIGIKLANQTAQAEDPGEGRLGELGGGGANEDPKMMLIELQDQMHAMIENAMEVQMEATEVVARAKKGGAVGDDDDDDEAVPAVAEAVDLTIPRNTKRRLTQAEIKRNKHIGEPVGFIHKSWDLVMNVMLGVRLAVGRIATEANREINPSDFNQHDQYTLEPNKGTMSDQVSAFNKAQGMKEGKAPFLFIDHCAPVFHQLRLRFGIDTNEYMKSIGPESMLSNLMLGNLSTLSELVSEGKSGSFFYFTTDGRYMIKTLRPEEKTTLSEILPDYYYHMMRNPDSMLTRFLGMHELHKREGDKKETKYYFVVMQSVFVTKREIHSQFDLKGSWIKRCTDPEKRVGQTLKDLDFCAPEVDDSWAGKFGVPFSKTAEAVALIEKPQRKIELGEERARLFTAQCKKDTAFLARHHIIDYSLLLGINQPAGASVVGQGNPMAKSTKARSATFQGESENIEGAPFFQKDQGGMRSENGQDTYFVGIIDILIQFGSKKRIEHKWKSVRTPGKNSHGEFGISVVPPDHYADRFCSFMDRCVE